MKRAIAAACAAILLALPLTGCGEPYAPAEDEIALQIQLDLDEDIGLLVIDYAAGESSGSGGRIQRRQIALKAGRAAFLHAGEALFSTTRRLWGSLRLAFTVITEYQEPNYENVYPGEYTCPRAG